MERERESDRLREMEGRERAEEVEEGKEEEERGMGRNGIIEVHLHQWLGQRYYAALRESSSICDP